jgi:hypothetical protein
VVEATEPVVETAAPVVEATAPVVEATAPVVGPVVEATAPVVDATAPVVEAAEPVVEPVVGAGAPARQLPGYTVAAQSERTVHAATERTADGATGGIDTAAAEQPDGMTDTAPVSCSPSVEPSGAASLSMHQGAPDRLSAKSTPDTAPSDAPELPVLPSSGAPTASAGGLQSAAIYAILVGLSALALSQLGRLQLMPARWRCTAFLALLERPG